MTRAQGKHREFSLNQSVATLEYIATSLSQFHDPLFVKFSPRKTNKTPQSEVVSNSFGKFLPPRPNSQQ